MLSSIVRVNTSAQFPASGTKSNETVSSLSQKDSQSSKLPPNAKIVGNYLLGKNIGQGTFGKVHLALHLPTNEKVAVKLIDKKSIRPKDVPRVKNEIAILSQIRHRNILHLYQIIETEKSLLLITEYLEQGQLFRKIIKEKKIPEPQACAYFHQIISGVNYLHSNRIAHRDLKPQNILIDYDGQLKIIDFGLSAHFSKSKELQSFCGSPCYAAPEIIQGKTGYNPLQTDLWSCGVILFAMICGYLPFCDQDTHTLYKKILACSFKFPPHISAGAKDLISNLLVKNPSKRLSIEDVCSHQWFCGLTPQVSYGIGKGERLKIDFELVSKAKELKVNESNLIEGLQRNELNKDTASYFILMKKVVKSGEKMPFYIGSDHFDPFLIEKNYDKEGENKTETESDPLTIFESTSAPDMTGQHEEKVAGSSPDLWHVVPELEEEKQVSPENFKKIYQGVLEVFFSAQKNTALQDIFRGLSRGKDNNSKFTNQQRKDEFYAFNKNHEKAMTNLQQYKTLLGTIILEKIGRFSVKKDKKGHSVQREKYNEVHSLHEAGRRVHFQEREGRELKKIQRLIESDERRRDVRKVLPYLSFFQNMKLKEKISELKSKPFRTLVPLPK